MTNIANYMIVYVRINVPITSITVMGTSNAVLVNRTEHFHASVMPQNPRPTNPHVRWESSNPAVATVDAAGNVRTTATPGTAVIRAISIHNPAIYGERTIRVVLPQPTGVAINPGGNFTFAIGATRNLGATVHPANAYPRTVTWSSSNTRVATVSANGLVTAVGGGSATITVRTQNGRTATVRVDVPHPAPAPGEAVQWNADVMTLPADHNLHGVDLLVENTNNGGGFGFLINAIARVFDLLDTVLNLIANLSLATTNCPVEREARRIQNRNGSWNSEISRIRGSSFERLTWPHHGRRSFTDIVDNTRSLVLVGESNPTGQGIVVGPTITVNRINGNDRFNIQTTYVRTPTPMSTRIENTSITVSNVSTGSGERKIFLIMYTGCCQTRSVWDVFAKVLAKTFRYVTNSASPCPKSSLVLTVNPVKVVPISPNLTSLHSPSNPANRTRGTRSPACGNICCKYPRFSSRSPASLRLCRAMAVSRVAKYVPIVVCSGREGRCNATSLRSELLIWTTDLPCARLLNSFCWLPLEIVMARNSGFIVEFARTIFKSPPRITPPLPTTEAREISSAVSPEDGTITSPPRLITDLSFMVTKVSTSSIMVSYFVYSLPYRMMGAPSSVKSLFE